MSGFALIKFLDFIRAVWIHAPFLMLAFYANSIRALLAKVRLLRAEPLANQELCLEIQEILIRKISYLEKRIRLQKERARRYKQFLRTKQSPPLTKANATAIKSRIEDCQYLIGEYQHLQFLFRSIGDALAFIYIDSWDIKPMTFKEASGALSGKKGARLERKILRSIVKSGHVAILNDLTNCLRYGDITVIQDGFPHIFEVKSGRADDARAKRQIENIGKLQEYLYTDKITGLYSSDLSITRTASHSSAIYNRDKLNNIIEGALTNGRDWVRAEEGLYYYVEAAPGSSGLDEVIAQCTSPPIVFYLNAMKYGNASYYPFSLTIDNPEALLQFYAGELLILVFIDPTVITKKFAAKGLTVSFNEPGDYALTIKPQTKIEDKPAILKIGTHMFLRVPFEFLSLNWLLDEFIHRFFTPPSTLHP